MVRIKFQGTENSKYSDDTLIEVRVINNELLIDITSDDSGDPTGSWIKLDKETATNLIRELRKQILIME